MDNYPDPDDIYDPQDDNIDPDDYELALQMDIPDDEQPVFTLNTSSIQKSQNLSAVQNKNLSQDLFSQNVSYSQTDVNIFQKTQPLPILNNANDNSNKRNVEELFGDISDIDFLENSQRAKKPKPNQSELDAELINIITVMRKEKNKFSNFISNKEEKEKRMQEWIKENISYRYPRWPSISLMHSDGKRLYIRCHSEDYMLDEIKSIAKKNTFIGVMGNKFKDVWKEANEIINKKLENQTLKLADVQIVPKSTDSNQLWVEQYKPRRYIELLSDENTNRTLLHWVKLWDKVVFNREIKKPKINKIPDSEKSKFQFKNKLLYKLDEHHRPEYKVALLSGPPGLGKTTLAHMVAFHAGYNPVEINASDDRSTEALKNALENATQMKSVIDSNKRPNCLIIDEIDGAPTATVEFLVKYVTGTYNPKVKKGTKKAKPFLLKRPVICICNDLYVPALRSLRQIALNINFPQTSNARLAERLMEVSRFEKIQTDLSAMLALSEKSQKDIRSCLSILQIFKSENKPIRLSDIHKTSVGQKDLQKGLFSVWQEIFQIHRPKHGEITVNSRARHVQHIVQSYGDYDKLTQGVFENYLTMKQGNVNLQAISESLEWFCVNDVLTKKIYEGQNFMLLPYIQFAFIVWHFAFASFLWPKISYPNTAYEVSQKQQRNTAIIQEVIHGASVSASCGISTPTPLLLDTLPLLVAQLAATPLRPTGVALHTPQDTAELHRVVCAMLDYGLGFCQRKAAQDMVYEFVMEPDVEQLVYFGESKVSTSSTTYAVRQMIAREIEMEKLRRAEFSLTRNSVDNKENKTKNSSVVPEDTNLNKENNPNNSVALKDRVLPNHLQRLMPRKVQKENLDDKLVGKDFFGRAITKIQADNQRGRTQRLPSGDIWYHFKEGYTNAVRTSVKIDYFM